MSNPDIKRYWKYFESRASGWCYDNGDIQTKDAQAFIGGVKSMARTLITEHSDGFICPCPDCKFARAILNNQKEGL
jgi:hypothetical protein